MVPLGPAVMSIGLLPGFRPALYSVIVPEGVILPIAGAVPPSVHHILPPCPRASRPGTEPGFSPLPNSVIVTAARALVAWTQTAPTTASESRRIRAYLGRRGTV